MTCRDEREEQVLTGSAAGSQFAAASHQPAPLGHPDPQAQAANLQHPI